MKKYLLALSLLLLVLVGCNVVTPTPVSTATPFGGETETPTATEILKTPEATGTNTPDATVTPFILPSATASLQPTPTQFVPPTNLPQCISVPCGPNLFFNSGFEVRTDWNAAQGNPYNFVLEQEFSDIPNILLPSHWNFEYKLGTNERNPNDPNCGQLQTPEGMNALRDNPQWSYRVDGYNPITNPEAFRWFKSWGCINAGPTQSVSLLEGHTYDVSFKVSTWSSNLYGMKYAPYSLLENDEQKANVEYRIRYNLNNGSVFDGTQSRAFTYADGIYDFVVDSNGIAHYNGYISMRFTVPTNSDDDSVTQVNIGVTGSALFAFDAVDYHVDNAGLYCMDCGFDAPVPTQDPNATPTQIINIDPSSYKFVTVVVDSLRVRRGASIDSPLVYNSDGSVKRILAGEKLPVFTVYQNETTGEIWARIDNPNVCLLLNMCDDSEWIAVQNSVCSPNNTCAILGND